MERVSRQTQQPQTQNHSPLTSSFAVQQEPGRMQQVTPASAYRQVSGGLGGYTTADILSLQQTIGNQAVQRLLAKTAKPGVLPSSSQLPLTSEALQAEETSDQCLPGSQVPPASRLFPAPQQQSELLQRKENVTGLPDRLKAGVETLSGLSLDNVQVHYFSSLPIAVQALAYTKGTEIHMGPGQERYLAHETWHVVQQMQGRVRPTMQVRGMTINDNQGLEHEADVMGEKALQVPQGNLFQPLPGSITEGENIQRLSTSSSMQPGGSQPVIQRAVGFEMQTSMAVRDKDGQKIGYQTEIYLDLKGNPSSVSIAPATEKRYYEMSADSGFVPSTESGADKEALINGTKIQGMETSEIEFVTPPQEVEQEVQVVGRRLDHMRAALDTMTAQATQTTTIEKVVAEYEQILQSDSEIDQDNTERARGIKLAGAIIGQTGGTRELNMAVAPQTTMGITLSNLLPFVRQLLASDTDSPLISPFWRTQLAVLVGSVEKYKMPEDAQGLAFLVESYLLGGKQQSELFDYPKQAVPLMARTDFHSMFLTLSAESQEAFQQVFLPAFSNRPEPVFKFGFPAHYETDLVSYGPGVGDWVSSIVEPANYPLDIYDINSIWTALRIPYASVLEQKGNEQITKMIQESDLQEEEKQKALVMHQALSRSNTGVAEKEQDASLLNDKENDFAIIDLLASIGENERFSKMMTSQWDKALAMQQALQDRDLMSRGSVLSSASSMGAMQVPDKGAEADMAILENRMMPGWGGKQAGDLWQKTLPATFTQIQSLLPVERQEKLSGVKRKKRLEPGSSLKEVTAEEHVDKDRKVSPKERLIALGLKKLASSVKRPWQELHPSGSMEQNDPPDYGSWETAIMSIADGSEEEMTEAIFTILKEAAQRYLQQ